MMRLKRLSKISKQTHGKMEEDSIRNRWRYLPRLFRLLWELGHREVMLIALFLIAKGLAPVISVAILRQLVDSAVGVVEGKASWSIGALWLAAFLIISFLQEFFQIANQWIVGDTQGRLKARAEEQLLSKASSLSLAAFERPEFYDRLHRAKHGLDSRLFTTMESFFSFPSALVTAIGLLAYVGSAHLLFPAILLVGLLPLHIVSARLWQKRYSLERNHTASERMLAYLSGLMIGRKEAAEVRLFGLQAHLLDRRQGLFHRLQGDRLKLAGNSFRLMMLWHHGPQLAYGLVIAGVVALVARGSLSVGYYAAYLGAAERFQLALGSLFDAIRAIDSDLRYIRDLIDYLDIDEEDVPHLREVRVSTVNDGAAPTVDPSVRATMMSLPDGVPLVRFEAVTFSYPGSDRRVLYGVDFSLNPGERIALVGENGAGKTTLAKLLLGLYRPTAGRIMVNDIDLGEIDPRWWRERIAAVFQDYVKYELTARENIGFGDLSRMEDELAIQSAAAKSGADEEVAGLPAAYDTVLGKAYDERGQDLSIGQWQKLAIARAYMRDALVLVLDEPTAALDAKSEVEIYRQFRDMSQGKSVLFISHRLGSARLADRILFLEAGRIVEEGSHADLMAQGGRYAKMYSIQAGWYQ
jgi:ATP-binding cassette subfamily B protein